MAKKPSGSSQREKLRRVRNEGTPVFTPEMLKEIESLKSLPSHLIDTSDPDSPDLSDRPGWVRGAFYRPRKQAITIRLDMDVLDWFKNQPGRYQSAINEACREYMEAQVRKGRNPSSSRHRPS